MGEWVARWLRRFGRPLPEAEPSLRHLDMERVDMRLTELERKERETDARLRLLEVQGDPRDRLRGLQ